MIIEVEDRFCKVAKAFSKALEKLERAAERGDAVHEVEEMTLGDLIEVGRQMTAAYIMSDKGVRNLCCRVPGTDGRGAGRPTPDQTASSPDPPTPRSRRAGLGSRSDAWPPTRAGSVRGLLTFA